MSTLRQFQDRFRLKDMRWAIALSLVIHLLFLISKIDQLMISLENEKVQEKKAVEVNLVNIEDFNKVKEQVVKISKDKQIVNNENTSSTIKPKETRFLGAKDQNFKKETVSKATGIFKKAGEGKKSGNKVKLKNKNRVTLKDLAIIGQHTPKDFKKALEDSSSKLGVKSGDANKVGLGRNNDFVEEIPLGDMTNLNTTEFKYYGFYHRIRQKLEQFWGKSVQEESEKLFRSGKRLPSNKNHITSLVISLDSRGNIVKVYVNTKSGFEELDMAAVQSFNKAGPFPNPPKGMLNREGHAVIKWGFVVKS